jgi:hypothetical protein
LSNKNEESSDIYQTYKKNVDTYFGEVRKTTASYIQAVSDLQMEIVGSWKNTIDSAIIMQEKFTGKSGTKATLPDTTVKMIMDVSEQINKTQAMQNKMLLASINAMSQNIKTFNENVKVFDELRSKIIESFMSSTPKVDPETFKKAVSEFKKTKGIEIETRKS